jgi:hypothetical protein
VSTAALSTPEQPQSSIAQPLHWNPATRIAFRFACLYLTLYCLPGGDRSSVVDAIPKIDEWITAKFWVPWKVLCPWAAVHVFHLSGPVTQYHPTGSGDTTLDYVQVSCFLMIAAAGTLVWSLLDGSRTEYRTLYAWVRLFVRYTLAITLLSYAFVKLYPLQFPHPPLRVLVESYGESSPMRLLWTFMGLSRPYAFFAGFGELLAGLLLLFRRTTALGALVAIGVMANVVAMNFCYDVPVKLYSSHLLAMAIFLLLPDMKSLWSFFILHRPAAPEGLWIAAFPQRWMRIGAVVLQVWFIASILWGNIVGGYKTLREYAEAEQPSPAYGVWQVSNFVVLDGGNVGPAWHRVVMDSVSVSSMYLADGSVARIGTHYDAGGKRFTLESQHPKHSGELSYSQPDRQHLTLSGTIDGQKVQITLQNVQPEKFLLTNRGFHWINEDPFNR